MPLLLLLFVAVLLLILNKMAKSCSKSGTDVLYKKYMKAARALYAQWEDNTALRFLLRITGTEHAAVDLIHESIGTEREMEWNYVRAQAQRVCSLGSEVLSRARRFS